MRFSVIVPSKDGAKRITKALNSIKEQTFADYELIVVCDTCVDNTSEIAQSGGAQTIICNHQNPGEAMNEGLKIAQGEYILFCNDDDWFLHKHVFDFIDRQLKLTQADILCFGFIMGKMGYKRACGNAGSIFPGQTLKAWRRDKIGTTRFCSDAVLCDYNFAKEMFAKNLMIATWDEPLYYHDWMRKGSITEVSKNGIT